MTTADWFMFAAIFPACSCSVPAAFPGDFDPKQNYNPRERVQGLRMSSKPASWAQRNSATVITAFPTAVIAPVNRAAAHAPSRTGAH